MPLALVVVLNLGISVCRFVMSVVLLNLCMVRVSFPRFRLSLDYGIVCVPVRKTPGRAAVVQCLLLRNSLLKSPLLGCSLANRTWMLMLGIPFVSWTTRLVRLWTPTGLFTLSMKTLLFRLSMLVRTTSR